MPFRPHLRVSFLCILLAGFGLTGLTGAPRARAAQPSDGRADLRHEFRTDSRSGAHDDLRADVRSDIHPDIRPGFQTDIHAEFPADTLRDKPQSATSDTAVADTPSVDADSADSIDSISGEGLRAVNGGDEYRDGYRDGYRKGYDAGYREGFRAGQDAAQAATAPRTQLVHSIGVEFRGEYIFPSNPFLAGDNLARRPIDRSLAGHLRYAFRYRPGSRADRIYGGAYQGVGLACYDFGNRAETGRPVALYLFQGARLARLAPQLSLDYEWNLGLSFGWKPYDPDTNPMNGMTGSHLNALVNVDLLLRWQLHPHLHFTAGVALTHFSNGNTQFPNAGLNSLGLRAGLAYDFNVRRDEARDEAEIAPFRRHVSYDLTLFGAWRRRGVDADGTLYAVPEAFPVAGISFAPMYNFGYRFRAGVSLDAVYDGSANLTLADQIVSVGDQADIVIERPGFDRQIALGLSARAEFVMPHFSVGIGLGGNILHGGGDLRSFYQMLTLKVAMTRNSYLHVGYSLRDFHLPNFLMLGVGYRFNNKYPRQR